MEKFIELEAKDQFEPAEIELLQYGWERIYYLWYDKRDRLKKGRANNPTALAIKRMKQKLDKM